MPRLLIAASGTGGHIYPALAFANSLSRTWEIHWLGVPNRLEIELVPKKYHLSILKVGGLQGNIFRKIFELLKLLFSSIQVAILLRQKQINLVLTTGGYISAPSIIGAKLIGIPIILHESNSIPGKVTRFLGRFCDHIALGMPSAEKYLFGCKTSFTGTPVRSEFFLEQPLPSWVPRGGGELILIMGGSQGAQKLNEMVRNFLPELLEKDYRVVHLTGKNDPFYRHLEKVPKHQNLAVRHFSHELPALLQHADLAISRSGAGAISELLVTNTPAILVPFPSAADQHQELNAAYMAVFGGAVIVNEHNPLDNILKNNTLNILESSLLMEMKFNMSNKSIKHPEDELNRIISNFI